MAWTFAFRNPPCSTIASACRSGPSTAWTCNICSQWRPSKHKLHRVRRAARATITDAVNTVIC
eukprot:2528459-Alexandrium_andersonii.AAC.1